MEIRLSLSGEKVKGFKELPFDAVGLIRGEFILRENLISLRAEAAQIALREYLEEVTTEFNKKEVWYRLSDLWSDEAAVLLDNKREYVAEHNPMLGNRGIRRRIEEPDLLETEIRLISVVAKKNKNLNLIVPFVQDAEEFGVIYKLARSFGFQGRIGAMLEIPSAILLAKEFVEAGATNLLIGLNDLSCLTLGQNRGGNEVKLHPAIWKMIGMLKSELPLNFEWGVAGSLDADILNRCQIENVPYCSVHYAEALNLIPSLPKEAFIDIGHVRRVKYITNNAKKKLSL